MIHSFIHFLKVYYAQSPFGQGCRFLSHTAYVQRSAFIHILLFFIVLIYSFDSYAQGKIDTSTKELNKERKQTTPNSINPKRPISGYGAHNDFEKEIENTIVGSIVGGMVRVVAWALVGNYQEEKQLNNRITVYPYCSQFIGNYAKKDSIQVRRSIRFDIEDQFLFSDKELYGNHFKAKLRPFHYFYFQTEMFQLVEYNKALDKHAHLLLYNLDFCYDRMRFERFNIGWTAGVNYVANDVKKGGFAFGFQTDIFITKPISIFSSVKWSSVNGQALNTFEVQGRYHQKNFFITLGYQYLRIASPRYNFASLGLGIYL